MKISTKIQLAFASIFLIMLFSGLYSLILNQKVDDLISNVENKSYPLNQASTNFQRAVKSLWIGTYIYTNGDEEMGRQYLNNGKSEMRSSRLELEKYLENSGMEDLLKMEQNAIKASQQVIFSKKENSSSLKYDLKLLQQRVDALNLKLSGLVDESQENMVKDLSSSKKMAKMTSRSALISMIVSALLAIILSISFSGLISKPIKQLTSAANKIAKGDLEVEIPDVKTEDEIQDLAESMKGVLVAVEFLSDEVNQ